MFAAGKIFEYLISLNLTNMPFIYYFCFLILTLAVWQFLNKSISAKPVKGIVAVGVFAIISLGAAFLMKFHIRPSSKPMMDFAFYFGISFILVIESIGASIVFEDRLALKLKKFSRWIVLLISVFFIHLLSFFVLVGLYPGS